MFVVAMTQSIFFLYFCVSRELIAYVCCGYDTLYSSNIFVFLEN